MRSVILLIFTVVLCISLIAQTNEKQISVVTPSLCVSIQKEISPDYLTVNQLGQLHPVSNTALLDVSQFNHSKGNHATQSTEYQASTIIWYITIFSGVFFLVSLIALRYVWNITRLGLYTH